RPNARRARARSCRLISEHLVCTMRAMTRPPIRPAAAVALLCALLAAGCDDGPPGETVSGSTTTTATETRPATSSVAVYLLRDGKVSPVRRAMETTTHVRARAR